MTILNWGSSVSDPTIDTSGVFFVPETEAQRFARTGEALPANLMGKNDFGLGFRFTVDPASGEGTYVLDPNGLKISSGSVEYSAAGADDFLQAVGYPPGILSGGIYLNALDLTTIRMGDGDDDFSVIGQGITQSIRADVNIDASQGYIFQSSIFAGGGDDRVSVLMPWQSVFKGGANTTYYDAVFGADPGGGIGITLSGDLTLEEVEYGDLIVLKGSRFDWDIEFKDGDGDGVVTLDSILDERDFLAVSNNNQISGFERILFGDILFDLVLYRQQESSAVFGQPDYYLNGLEALAPELNSDITSGSELWEAFRFNRTKLQGITGTATDQTDVYTGDANDTPFLVGALRFASLNTEAGNDIVEIGTPGQTAVKDASIDLGEGNDQLKVNGLFTRSSVAGGTGDDNIILTTIESSSVDAGSGDDVVEVTGSASQTRFVGGDDLDVLLLPGSFATYLLTSSESGGVITFNDAFGNSITGFETIRFDDINLDALQTLSLTGPAAPVSEGTSASYTIALSGSALAAGESVAFTLQLGNDTAQFSSDLAELVPGSLQAAAGIVVSSLSVDAGTGLIRAVATASRAFSEGAAIATLSLPVVADLQNEPSETFTVTLTDFVQAQTVTTTIADVPPLTIRLTGAATVSEGQQASYEVVLDGVGLAAGRSVTFSLDSASGTATEGVDFAPLLAELLQPAAGISLGGISTAADGTVTVTATNISGAALTVGATLLSLQLPITTDSLVEANETFGVTLASSTAVVSSGVVTTTITDVVPTPMLVLSGQFEVVEGQSAAYAVSLGGSGLLAGQSVTLTLDSASGTATEGLDFAALTAGAITAGAGVALSPITTDPVTKALTLTATNTSGGTQAAGSQLLSFSIATTADLFKEGPETFDVSLTSANATVSGGSITTTVSDNDPLAVRISGPASVAEGSSTTPYTIALGSGVGLGADRSVTFSIDSASGTATEGLDFAALADAALTAAPGIDLALISTAADGRLTLTATNNSGADLVAGSALASFAITTNNDLIAEGNESFSLNLAGGAGVTVEGPASVVTTITDDDAPVLKLTGSATVAEGASANYTLALDGVGLGAGRSVTFTLDAASGTAIKGVDFAALTAAALTAARDDITLVTSTATSGAITVTATNSSGADLAIGASILSFSLAASADSIVEGIESYAVSLSGANGSGSVVTTITDANNAVIRLSGAASVLEGANASYAVSLDGVGLGAGQSVTLTLDTEGITATEGVDFAALTAADLAAGAGVTLGAIRTDPVSNAVTLTATNTSGASLAAGSQLVSFSTAAIQDQSTEGDEAFRVLLDSEAATLTNKVVETTIRDLVSSGGDGGSGDSGGSGSGGDGGVPGGGGDDGGGSGGGGGSGEPSPRRRIRGTDGADEITGNSRNNVIYGGKGADLMTGGGGSNTFRFKLRDGLDQGDVITDFRPGSDRIRVEGVSRNSLAAKAFGGKKRLKGRRAKSAVQVVDSLDSSDRSKAVFIYAQLTGELAYNANGRGRGFGRDGGVIAALPVLLSFEARDIQLAYGS
jgi:hypothetical protein